MASGTVPPRSMARRAPRQDAATRSRSGPAPERGRRPVRVARQGGGDRVRAERGGAKTLLQRRDVRPSHGCTVRTRTSGISSAIRLAVSRAARGVEGDRAGGGRRARERKSLHRPTARDSHDPCPPARTLGPACHGRRCYKGARSQAHGRKRRSSADRASDHDDLAVGAAAGHEERAVGDGEADKPHVARLDDARALDAEGLADVPDQEKAVLEGQVPPVARAARTRASARSTGRGTRPPPRPNASHAPSASLNDRRGFRPRTDDDPSMGRSRFGMIASPGRSCFAAATAPRPGGARFAPLRPFGVPPTGTSTVPAPF